MLKVLIVDTSIRDTQRFQHLLEREGIAVEVCLTGEQADELLTSRSIDFSAAVILWDMPGQVSGGDLLLKCQRLLPEMPVVVTTVSLDASMATRAYAFGARDFLEKPFDSQRILSSLRLLLSPSDLETPLVLALRERILGNSSAIVDAVRQLARVIPHVDSRVLLIGESGTGKELFAQAIHEFGPRHNQPWVAINISSIPENLIESALFGHEKGAFTGATERHIGVFEEAGDGTVFLDEIGDLELALQSKLLRVIQEKRFRRLRGHEDIIFKARLVCATNRNLALAVNQAAFRRDLFHRIAEVTIEVPPLRSRKGDVDLLLNYFLDSNRGTRELTFARETLAILRSYPFWGNVRELENIVKSALIECESSVILPQHLPLKNMGKLIVNADIECADKQSSPKHEADSDYAHEMLINDLVSSLPTNWTNLAYKDAALHFTHALDRVYLQRKLERWRHNITQAARDAGIDSKTFRRRWKEAGLPPLTEGETDAE